MDDPTTPSALAQSCAAKLERVRALDTAAYDGTVAVWPVTIGGYLEPDDKVAPIAKLTSPVTYGKLRELLEEDLDLTLKRLEDERTPA